MEMRRPALSGAHRVVKRIHLDDVLKTERSKIEEHLHNFLRQVVETAFLESNLKFLGGVKHSLPYAFRVPSQIFNGVPGGTKPGLGSSSHTMLMVRSQRASSSFNLETGASGVVASSA